ncbi:MAG: dihydroneopterin aldolase [Lentisphaeria bacterium]|nr:dihydroneopterin aldolase [Lentisphaeria bacterium]
MDKIFITGLPLSTVIGTRPEERDLQQKIILDLEIDIDLSAASASDDLLDTINYAEIEEKMVKLAEESHFFLIEAFAQAAADIVLSYEKTTGCTVTVTKPNASHRATVKVVLRREK